MKLKSLETIKEVLEDAETNQDIDSSFSNEIHQAFLRLDAEQRDDLFFELSDFLANEE